MDLLRNIPSFIWDRKLNRYRYKDTGKFLSKSAADAILKRQIDYAQKELLELGDKLISDDLSLLNWQLETAQTIKSLVLSSYTVAKGGKENMSPEDYLAVGREVKRWYGSLRGLAIDVNNGYILTDKGVKDLTLNRFRQRLKNLSNSAKTAKELARRQLAKESGIALAYRKLGFTDRHCASCIRYAQMGIRPINEIPLVGTMCECGGNCVCTMHYMSATDLANFADRVAS